MDLKNTARSNRNFDALTNHQQNDKQKNTISI